jgi:hypothetical protein
MNFHPFEPIFGTTMALGHASAVIDPGSQTFGSHPSLLSLGFLSWQIAALH